MTYRSGEEMTHPAVMSAPGRRRRPRRARVSSPFGAKVDGLSFNRRY